MKSDESVTERNNRNCYNESRSFCRISLFLQVEGNRCENKASDNDHEYLGFDIWGCLFQTKETRKLSTYEKSFFEGNYHKMQFCDTMYGQFHLKRICSCSI